MRLTCLLRTTVLANHGGGYRFSLCALPKTFGGRMDVTEECFNERPLNFVSQRSSSGDPLPKSRLLVTTLRPGSREDPEA